MFGSVATVGNDILDIGSRKAETRARRQRGAGSAMGPPPLVLGEPGTFDVPNVPDVSFLEQFAILCLSMAQFLT